MEWFLTQRPTRPGWSGPARAPDPDDVAWHPWIIESGPTDLEDGTDPILLLETNGGRTLLLDVENARELAGASSAEVRRRAASAATAWWKESDRRTRTRARLLGLVDFGSRIESIDRPAELLRALVEDAGRLVGAAGGAVVERTPAGAARFAFPTEVEGGPLHWSPFLDRVGVRRSDEFQSEDAQRIIMALLARVLRATYVMHHPIEPGRTLLLAERRTTRIFDDEDWAVLQGLTQQTRAALERIRLTAGASEERT